MPNDRKAEDVVVGLVGLVQAMVVLGEDFGELVSPDSLVHVNEIRIFHEGCDGCVLGYEADRLVGTRCGIVILLPSGYQDLDDPVTAIMNDGQPEAPVNDHLTLRKHE